MSDIVNSKDLHGREQIGRSILTNWGAQLIQILSGFLVPRLIDRGLGQEALGMWDFAWSLVVYFSLVQMGVTSSINRYVARERARNDWDAVNRSVSSIAVVMRCMAGLVLILAIAFSFGAGHMLTSADPELVRQVQWVIFLLGVDFAIQVGAAVYGSVLTGCHRWDWHNGVQTGVNALSLMLMITGLQLGFGLIGLAAAYTVSGLLGRIARLKLAHHACPSLEVRWKHFQWSSAREMLSFGGKYFVSNVSQMLVNSGTGLLTALYLGPAMLAVYMRPFALIRSLGVFVNKYAMVFSPTISSLQGAGQTDAVRDLALKSTRYGLYILLPGIAVLSVFGDVVVHFWMGAGYVDQMLILILSVGFLNQLAYIPLFKALVGLDRHGWPGAVNLIGACLALALVWLNLAVLNGGITGVAVAVTVPLTLINAIYLPLYACSVFEIRFSDFVREVWKGPLEHVAAFIVGLVLARICAANIGNSFAAGVGICAFIFLAVSYWTRVMPDRWKSKLLARFRPATEPTLVSVPEEKMNQ